MKTNNFTIKTIFFVLRTHFILNNDGLLLIMVLLTAIFFLLIGFNLIKIKWNKEMTKEQIRRARFSILICGVIEVFCFILKIIFRYFW